jgi:hypothetical protein
LRTNVAAATETIDVSADRDTRKSQVEHHRVADCRIARCAADKDAAVLVAERSRPSVVRADGIPLNDVAGRRRAIDPDSLGKVPEMTFLCAAVAPPMVLLAESISCTPLPLPCEASPAGFVPMKLPWI